MRDRQPAPCGLKVFEREAAVAMLGGRFAAQQHGRNIEQAPVNPLLDRALAHQRQKAPLIGLPASFLFFVVIEHLLRRSQQRLMEVISRAELTQEVAEVLFLGKACQLGNVVQSHI